MATAVGFTTEFEAKQHKNRLYEAFKNRNRDLLNLSILKLGKRNQVFTIRWV
jgi:hypothetical protein